MNVSLRRPSLIAIVCSVFFAVVACGSNAAQTPAPSTSLHNGDSTKRQLLSTSPPAALPHAAQLSPTAFCALLDDSDLRPLQQQPVDVGPAPREENGLPGCDWDLGGASRHLELSLFKAPYPEIIRSTATSTFPVGSAGTGYVSFGSIVGGCKALITTRSAPEAYFLAYSLEGLDDTLKGCAPGMPQVLKVLRELRW